MITLEQAKTKPRVWYEPSPGVRFLGTVVGEPRQLGGDHVVEVAMAGMAYGMWRIGNGLGKEPRTHVPAAALFALYMHESTHHDFKPVHGREPAHRVDEAIEYVRENDQKPVTFPFIVESHMIADEVVYLRRDIEYLTRRMETAEAWREIVVAKATRFNELLPPPSYVFSDSHFVEAPVPFDKFMEAEQNLAMAYGVVEALRRELMAHRESSRGQPIVLNDPTWVHSDDCAMCGHPKMTHPASIADYGRAWAKEDGTTCMTYTPSKPKETT